MFDKQIIIINAALYIICIILAIALVVVSNPCHADDAIRRTTPNVLTCQHPDKKLFFIFLNDNVIISEHMRKHTVCVDVMDTEGVARQFCSVDQSKIKCRTALGYRL